jgi:hypothetical protein
MQEATKPTATTNDFINLPQKINKLKMRWASQTGRKIIRYCAKITLFYSIFIIKIYFFIILLSFWNNNLMKRQSPALPIHRFYEQMRFDNKPTLNGKTEPYISARPSFSIATFSAQASLGLQAAINNRVDSPGCGPGAVADY